MLDLLNNQSIGQIKLHQLAVFNWGSFNGLHIANINENGTLITGDNGSGKSTLIDGLMALLVPAGKASFNIAAAQNDKSDRSLMSYIRGSYGSTNDGSRLQSKNKRNKATLTGLQAIYKRDNGEHISLMALFWINGSSVDNADIQKLYMVTHQIIPLKMVIDEFANNKPGLKKWLDKNNVRHTEKFSEYQSLYNRSLNLKDNAPALLTRALGLKKVDDLTDLIRTLVLEPSHHIKDNAKEIVKEFANLQNTYKTLIDIKEQLAHLEKLPKLSESLDILTSNISNLECLQEILPIYLAKIEYDELNKQKEQFDQQYHTIQFDISQKKQDLKLCRETVKQYEMEYHQVGGDRILVLEQEIDHLTQEYNRTNKFASDYQKICRNLGLNDELNKLIFNQNQQQYFEKKQKLSDELEQKENQRDEISYKLKNIQERIVALLKDIDIVEKSKSGIRSDYNSIRNKICQELNLTSDDIPFIGELLEVKESEYHWRGAIERAMSGSVNILLVRQSNYKKVTEWINKNHTGLRMRVRAVGQNISHKNTILENGFLSKLNVKNHPFSEWLIQFLSQYDLLCVDSIELAQITPFSMTIEGSIFKEKGRFEKDDTRHINDQSNWQLEFSNKTRLTFLKSELRNYQNNEKEFGNQLDKVKSLIDGLYQMITQWDRLYQVDWQSIDVLSIKSQKEEKEKQLSQLLQAGNQLDKIKQLLDNETQKEIQYDKEYRQLNIESGKINQQLQDIEKNIIHVQELAKQEIHHEYYGKLQSYYLKFAELKQMEQIKIQCQKLVNDDLNTEKSKKSTCENQIRGIIISFNGKEKWRHLTQEWRNDLSGLADYLVYYQKLKDEQLGTFEQQFQQRLNKHSSESLTSFTQSIQNTQEDIRQKISDINQVLQKTEFRKNSFLRLKTKTDKYPYNVEFDKLIKEVKSAYANNDTPEKRYQLLGKVVEMLEKATNPATANSQESLRLLEPRYQLSFIAEEIDETGKVIDELNSSSGKSGGEKESFAGMIMAASLAYVLRPNDGDKPAYCTVFLDEAFSNTQESVSRRVLKVFKDLHIHINLITPYKNLNLAKESAGSLIICEKNSATHESRLCEITWEQLDEHLRKNLQGELKQYGIELQEN